jgi:thiol-disulfide isomerase/thioredoxin
MKNFVLAFTVLFLTSCASKKAVTKSSNPNEEEITVKQAEEIKAIKEIKEVEEIEEVKAIAPVKALKSIQKQSDLVGYTNKNALLTLPYKTWFTENYNDYKFNENVIKNLSKNLKGISIKGFLGTWCKDSKRETPRFYKILEATDFDFENLQLIAVNRSKKTPKNLQKGYNIIRVPTFIFYKDGKEIGRYVEYARESLEKDMLTIVSGKPYKHSYEK